MSKTNEVNNSQILGYARVSTRHQKLDRQFITLEEYGCDRIFYDKATGTNTDRKGLRDLLEHVRAGDTVVLSELDRLGRSLLDVAKIISDFDKKGVTIKILEGVAKGIDTSNAFGKMFLQILAMNAELEYNMRKERIRLGVEAKKAKDPNYIHGRGSKPKVKKYKEIVKLHKEGFNNSQISRKLGITRHTVIKALKIYREESKS
jgi:DNA invertase Pin-like site-specific DNA recombinase